MSEKDFMGDDSFRNMNQFDPRFDREYGVSQGRMPYGSASLNSFDGSVAGGNVNLYGGNTHVANQPNWDDYNSGPRYGGLSGGMPMGRLGDEGNQAFYPQYGAPTQMNEFPGAGVYSAPRPFMGAGGMGLGMDRMGLSDLDAGFPPSNAMFGGGALNMRQPPLGNAQAYAAASRGAMNLGPSGTPYGTIANIPSMNASSGKSSGTGGSNAQGRAINKMLLDILRDRTIDPQRLHLAIETFIERMDCVNLATLLFHTGKKRFLLAPIHIKVVADRFNFLREELRAREASNALYGLKCLSSEIPEVRELVYALANKITISSSDFVAQAVGNALYGLQMMTSEYEEVRFLLLVLSAKVSQCCELLEAQNVGNALYGLRGMNSDYKEVRAVIAALTPKIAKAKEELNGQALGNSLYGLQSMSSKEAEVRCLLTVLAAKVSRTWEELKAQEVGNALYGLKRMSSDVQEVRLLLAALVPKIASSPDLLDAQAIGNSFYGLQNMKSDNPEVLGLMGVLAEKVAISNPELDGQAMGNALYGLQGMSSDFVEVRTAIAALTAKVQASCLEMNAQEIGNAMYGLQSMSSSQKEVRRLMLALAQKISASKHELTSQEIGNAMFGLQGMSSEHAETRILLNQVAIKINQSHSILDPQGVSNCLFGLQKLSSESFEVRGLLHAVAFKIEHCWKVLSNHQVAHACFGLQTLSSEHAEVRYLLKALVPKVISCREEMHSKQLAVAVFGLQNMSSGHVEVRALATALAEKATLSTDIWNCAHLSMAMFGLQGFSSDLEETSVFLSILSHKATLANLQEIEPTTLANWIYGMQRMRSTNPEVAKMLHLLLGPLTALSMTPDRFTPNVMASILFGLQGCNAAIEAVQVALDLMCMVAQSAGDLLVSLCARQVNCAEGFVEYLALFQTAALVVDVLPNLDQIPDLQQRCVQAVEAMEKRVTELSDLYMPRNLSVAESNCARDLCEYVRSESVVLKAPALVHGFEVSAALEAVSLGAPNEPKLAIEVVGSSYCFPAKEVFAQLRTQYLEKRGVIVKLVPAESFAMYGQKGLQLHPDVISLLIDENSPISGVMKTFSFSDIGAADPTLARMSRPYFPAPGAYDPRSAAQFAGMEYTDDEIKFSEHRTKGNAASGLPAVYCRRSFGLLLGWLGDWPQLNAPSAMSLANQQQLLRAMSMVSAVSPLAQQAGPSTAMRTSSLGTMLDRGMVPAANSIHRELLERHSGFKLSLSSDSTFIDSSAAPMKKLSGTTDEVESVDSTNSQGKTLTNPMFDTQGLLLSQSASFQLGASSQSAYAAMMQAQQDSGMSLRLVAQKELSIEDNTALPPGLHLNLAVGSSSRRHSKASNLSDLAPATPSEGDLSVADDNDEEDEEMQLLKAQLEIAKLEAKIKGLQMKKARANRGRSDNASLSDSSAAEGLDMDGLSPSKHT